MNTRPIYLTEELLLELLQKYNLPNDTFTKQEIEATGCKITQVAYESFEKVIKLRAAIRKPIILMHNGIASGNHLSSAHPLGFAIDISIPGFTLREAMGYIMALGIHAVGGYYNHTCYSFHIEYWPGKNKIYVRNWYWHKNKISDSWTKGSLFQQA